MTPDDSDPAAADAELQRQITALREALAAVAGGGVDAVVVGEPGQEQVYTLHNADRPYRVIVESMGEGSATVSADGVVLFANRQLAALLGVEHDVLLGHDFNNYVVADHREVVLDVLQRPSTGPERVEVALMGRLGEVPVLLSSTPLDMDGATVRCLVLTDLTTQKVLEEQKAAEVTLAEQRAERRRMAFEVNDSIVQGLVAAEIAFDAGQPDRARALIGRTLKDARAWIDVLVEAPQLEPGMAVRTAHADPGSAQPPPRP